MVAATIGRPRQKRMTIREYVGQRLDECAGLTHAEIGRRFAATTGVTISNRAVCQAMNYHGMARYRVPSVRRDGYEYVATEIAGAEVGYTPYHLNRLYRRGVLKEAAINVHHSRYWRLDILRQYAAGEFGPEV